MSQIDLTKVDDLLGHAYDELNNRERAYLVDHLIKGMWLSLGANDKQRSACKAYMEYKFGKNCEFINLRKEA